MEVRLSLDTKMWKILVRTRQWYTSFILFTYQSCMNLLNFGSFAIRIFSSSTICLTSALIRS